MAADDNTSPPEMAPKEPAATPPKKRRYWLWALSAVTGVGLVAGLALTGWVFMLARDLPDVSGLNEYSPGSVTRIYDVHNQLAGEYYSERRVYVRLEQVPQSLIQAVLSVEDTRFYTHMGVDPVRIGGAVIANFARRGLSQGGSTITQQLARTLFLSRKKTFTRKIKEALLSLRIEQVLTKDRILELYLNEIYFGNGAYGVQAAAQAYFGKDVAEINLPESAFMAGLPKAPSRYTPYRNPKDTKNRQGVVLRRMVDAGVIDWNEYQAAYAADMTFKRPHQVSRQAPYFMEEIRKHLSRTYGVEAVYQGGLSVYTTLDTSLQVAAEKAVKRGLRALDKRQGWRGPVGHLTDEEFATRKNKAPRARIRTELTRGHIYEGVVLEVGDDIRVLVEGHEALIRPEDMAWARRRLNGPDLKKDRKIYHKFVPGNHIAVGDVIHVGIKSITPLAYTLEQLPIAQAAVVALDPLTGEIRALVGGYDFSLSQFNRALMARRQPGSAFKPLVYGAAFDKGYSPASLVMDTPLVFHDSTTKITWKPENYEKEFFGPTTLREGLVHSRNVASIKLLRQLGIRPVVAFTRRLGITSNLAEDLSLALGSSSINVLELSRAYAVFASGGMRADPYTIRRVVDRLGNVLEATEPKVQRVISEETAYQVMTVLEDVIRRGTGRKARQLKAHLGGKTGTTNNFTDAWFMGSSANLTLGVWVGMDDHTTLGDKETGARAALPIWIDVMRAALKELPDVPFNIPKGIVYVKVDPTTGMRAAEGSKGVLEVFDRHHKPQAVSRAQTSLADFVALDMGAGGS